MVSRLHGLALVAVTVSLSTASAAQAPSAVSIEGVLSDACLGSEALRDRTARWLEGQTPDGRILVQVSSHDGEVGFVVRFAGRVVVRRRFELLPEGCSARVDAVAIAIAFAVEHVTERAAELEADLAAGTLEDAPETVSTPEPVPTSEPAPIAEPAPSPAPTPGPGSSRGPRVGLFGSVGAWAGAIPGLSLAGSLGFETQFARLRFRTGGLMTTPGRGKLGGGAFEVWLVGGLADVCFGLPVSSITLIGCAGARGGYARIWGVRFVRSRLAPQPWALLDAQVGVELPFSSVWRVRLLAEGVLPLFRPYVHSESPSGAIVDTKPVLSPGVDVTLELAVVFG